MWSERVDKTRLKELEKRLEGCRERLKITDKENKELKMELSNWKELFYLLKRDHNLQENFQTNNWAAKAREMGIEI